MLISILKISFLFEIVWNNFIFNNKFFFKFFLSRKNDKFSKVWKLHKTWWKELKSAQNYLKELKNIQKSPKVVKRAKCAQLFFSFHPLKFSFPSFKLICPFKSQNIPSILSFTHHFNWNEKIIYTSLYFYLSAIFDLRIFILSALLSSLLFGIFS